MQVGCRRAYRVSYQDFCPSPQNLETLHVRTSNFSACFGGTRMRIGYLDPCQDIFEVGFKMISVVFRPLHYINLINPVYCAIPFHAPL